MAELSELMLVSRKDTYIADFVYMQHINIIGTRKESTLIKQGA